jgi:hypothetical protein
VVDTLGCSPQQVLFLDDNRSTSRQPRILACSAVRVVGPLEAQRVLTEFGIIEARCRRALILKIEVPTTTA